MNKKTDNELTGNQKDFVDEYMINGRNATRAFMKFYKYTNYEAAATMASQLLKKPNVVLYLADKEAEVRQKYSLSKDLLINHLLDTVNDAKNEKDRKNLIKAIEVLNKMVGFNAVEKQEIEHKGITINYIKPE